MVAIRKFQDGQHCTRFICLKRDTTQIPKQGLNQLTRFTASEGYQGWSLKNSNSFIVLWEEPIPVLCQHPSNRPPGSICSARALDLGLIYIIYWEEKGLFLLEQCSMHRSSNHSQDCWLARESWSWLNMVELKQNIDFYSTFLIRKQVVTFSLHGLVKAWWCLSQQQNIMTNFLIILMQP